MWNFELNGTLISYRIEVTDFFHIWFRFVSNQYKHFKFRFVLFRHVKVCYHILLFRSEWSFSKYDTKLKGKRKPELYTSLCHFRFTVWLRKKQGISECLILLSIGSIPHYCVFHEGISFEVRECILLKYDSRRNASLHIGFHSRMVSFDDVICS